MLCQDYRQVQAHGDAIIVVKLNLTPGLEPSTRNLHHHVTMNQGPIERKVDHQCACSVKLNSNARHQASKSKICSTGLAVNLQTHSSLSQTLTRQAKQCIATMDVADCFMVIATILV